MYSIIGYWFTLTQFLSLKAILRCPILYTFVSVAYYKTHFSGKIVVLQAFVALYQWMLIGKVSIN